jgi:cytochrome c biogenesis protein CcmG/thiol:disulfide interchange protein DsbE
VRRGGALVAVVSAVVLLSTAWVFWGERGNMVGRAAEGTPVRVDRLAPQFTLPLLSDDGSLGLGRDQGVVVVNFWRSWCRPCRTEGRQLEALWSDYRARGVRFIGIDYRDDRSAAIDFVRSLGLTYPSVRDPDGTVGDDFGIFGLPTTFIVGTDGRMRYQVTGRVHTQSFRVALESVIGEGSSSP